MEELLVTSLIDFEFTWLEFVVRLLVAVGIGLSIGLEREFSTKSDEVQAVAGIRTFVFIVLLGFISTLLSITLGPWVFVVGLIGVILFVGISYWVSANQGELGGTTEMTTLIAYLIGGMLFLGYIEYSLVTTVIVLSLLSLKIKFRTFVGKMNSKELYALIQFIVVLLLVFPFLPDKTIGPYDVFNPQELGWIVIIFSGIGLSGYLLSKFIGTGRGIMLTGLIGGLFSSTMVSWIFSNKSKESPEYYKYCTSAVIAASSIMFVRIFIWVGIFKPGLINNLLWPFLMIFFTGLLISYYFYRKAGEVEVSQESDLGKPINWKQALLFSAFYTAILFIVSFANEAYGNSGVYISSAIASLTDADAITISVSKLAGDSISNTTAENAILLVALCNTIVKWGIAVWRGGPDYVKSISLSFLIIFISGGFGFFLLKLIG
jgi:uncharacterized membrane protein (DUF4010 family)